MIERDRAIEEFLNIAEREGATPDRKFKNELETLGYSFHEREGKLFVQHIPEKPFPWEIGRKLTVSASAFEKILYFESISSTNTFLLDHADELPSWTAVVAEEQTAGRGRRGASWFSPHGKNIYTSILIKPEISSTPHLSAITLTTGIAVARILESRGLHVGLKWPNDVTVHGKKLAGILTESRFTGDENPLIVVGIGINVNIKQEEFPPELQSLATSLIELTGRGFRRAEILSSLYGEIYYCYYKLLKEGFGFFVQEYSARSVLMGKEVIVKTDEITVMEGKVLGVDSDGALVVKLYNPPLVHRIYSGEVIKFHDSDH